MIPEPHSIYCPDNGLFPNSRLPVLFYRKCLDIPHFFAARQVKQIFARNYWRNAWEGGLFTYHHYHSNTHEAMGVIAGQTLLLLGGENGQKLKLEKGDVLIIPAGVAHKNLGHENDLTCIGAYPDGRQFDMNYGKSGERPGVDKHIVLVPVPEADPVAGRQQGVCKIWSQAISGLKFKPDKL